LYSYLTRYLVDRARFQRDEKLFLEDADGVDVSGRRRRASRRLRSAATGQAASFEQQQLDQHLVDRKWIANMFLKSSRDASEMHF